MIEPSETAAHSLLLAISL